MNSVISRLFGEDARKAAPLPSDLTGVLPYQAVKNLQRDGVLLATEPLLPEQFQPASIDLRLAAVAYRVRASFLPGPDATVMTRIRELDGYEIDLRGGAVLEKGCVYVIPLLEQVALKGTNLSALANPKSTAGRLDILTRLITDRGTAFDQVERGYEGPLYVEVAPRAFSVVVRFGSRLNQLRFKRGTPQISSGDLDDLFKGGKLIKPHPPEQLLRDGRVGVTIDLRGSGRGSLIGYRAQKHTDRIDIDNINHYSASEFWEKLYNHRDGPLILNPDDFYILATLETVAVPSRYAAEMVAYDTTVGEFRVHYAGFFDPGFGCDPSGHGSKAVLEVRSHAVPFMLEHGQIIGWLRYERMADVPDRLYGAAIGSNYQSQGLALAKQFRV
ncbi:MAG TPA: 2'-deoxycytidine 5'-triphosphate deaminase [Acetobacteraceae bacterium]|jgi:dCTP deaminase